MQILNISDIKGKPEYFWEILIAFTISFEIYQSGQNIAITKLFVD